MDITLIFGGVSNGQQVEGLRTNGRDMDCTVYNCENVWRNNTQRFNFNKLNGLGLELLGHGVCNEGKNSKLERTRIWCRGLFYLFTASH